MKEVTAIVKANVTVIYKIKDESEIKSVEEFNREFNEAMLGQRPFSFDDIQAIAVKNFLTDELKDKVIITTVDA